MPSTDLFIRVLSIVCPVFLTVLIGWGYGRRRHPDMAAANRMNMEIFIPALVFGTLAEGSFEIREQWRPALAMAIMVLGSGLLAWPIARLSGLSARTLAPPMMFNNCGNLGIPLAVLAFGKGMLPVAMILFLSSNLIHFSLGAHLLDRHQGPSTVFRIPVVIASLLGMTAALLHIEVWTPLLTAIRLMGDVSVPLMLFALGVKIAEAPMSHLKLSLLAGLLRPLLGIGWMLLTIHWLQISGDQARILILFGSLPPAVLNYMFAERYHQEPQKVASIVLMGNLLSVMMMPLVLGWVLSASL